MIQKSKDVKGKEANRKEDNPDKERALGAALAQIERQFGKGSMMRLGDK